MATKLEQDFATLDSCAPLLDDLVQRLVNVGLPDAITKVRDLRQTIADGQARMGVALYRQLSATVADADIRIDGPEQTSFRKMRAALRDRARSLRAEGKSYREIMAVVNVSFSQVSEWCSDVVMPNGLQRVRVPENMPIRAKARELRRQGLAFKDIADKLGVPYKTAHNWARDILVKKKSK